LSKVYPHNFGDTPACHVDDYVDFTKNVFDRGRLKSDSIPRLDMEFTGGNVSKSRFHTAEEDRMDVENIVAKERERMEAEIEELREEANDLLEAAKEKTKASELQAKELIDDARRKTEEIEAIAYQAGFAQGEQAGTALAEQKMEPVIRNLTKVIASAADQEERILREREEELVRVAFVIARKVLHRELLLDESVVLSVVREALTKARRASTIALRVSPQDFRFLEGHMEQMKSLVDTETQIQIEPDPKVSRGGCRLSSNMGEIDSTLETMFENLEGYVWDKEE
jgi:flagellar assembly protein FliH